MRCVAAKRLGSNMIVTSKGVSVLRFRWLIAVFPRTGGYPVRRWEKSPRRTTKILTVAHFQMLAFDRR